MPDHPSPSFRSELSRFIRFGVVGVLNTAVDYGVFWICAALLLWNPYLSQTISYACGVLNSYILNRSWTFRSKDRFFSPQLIRFLAVNLLTLLLSLGALWLFSKCFPVMIAKPFTIGVTMVVGFVLNRLWVFQPPHSNS